MHIAIIDHSNAQARNLQQVLAVINPENQVENFTFQELTAEKGFDLYFIDLSAQGLQLADHLSQQVPNVPYIFTGSSADPFIEEIYHLNLQPAGFLMQPYTKKSTARLLERLENKDTQRYLVLKTKNAVTRIRYNDIQYIESDNHYLNIVTPDNTFRIRRKLKELLAMLPESFFQCHQSYVLNLNKIQTMTQANFFLNDGMRIPISRKFKDASLAKWQQWLDTQKH